MIFRNYYQFFLIRKQMSILSLKLQQASKLFIQGNYPKSLEAYQECLNFCKKTDESNTVVFNILSIKGNIEYLLGQYDTALSTLNSVLKKDANHFLCLLRRSQVYKQKNKFKKALKDIETIQVFYPNNQRILSLKQQIGSMLSKQQKQQEGSSQSQAEEEEAFLELNFMKLKKIDRKSLDSSQIKQRKSQVTLLGDTTFQYKKEDDLGGAKDDENIKDKAVRTYSQIQLDYDEELQQTPTIHIKYEMTPKKSLLKNKGDKVFIQEEDVASRRSKYLGKESHFLNLIKNIDGKVILSAEHEHHSNPQIKEVQFRKSISSTNEFNMMEESTKALSIKSQRKSCLRRPNFEAPQMKSQQIRRSKFQLINQFQIDGRILTNKKRNSFQRSNEAKVEQKEKEGKDDSQSDDSSEHNIFGSKRYFLTTEMKHNLGIDQNSNQKKHAQTENSGNLSGKKSILRKVSALVTPTKSLLVKSKSNYQQPSELPLKLCAVKSKKSVLFNCTL